MRHPKIPRILPISRLPFRENLNFVDLCVGMPYTTYSVETYTNVFDSYTLITIFLV